MPDPADNLPPPEELQFRRAQPIGPDIKACIVCKQPIAGDYFQANGNILCPQCKQRIEAHQQPPPHTSLLRAALYGGAAALAGCIIYGAVGIFVQIGIIAILVGYMVGKAVRYASNGLGGRPQQILAVALTYFAITLSFVPEFIYQRWSAKSAVEKTRVTNESRQTSEEPRIVRTAPRMPPGSVILTVLGLAVAAPFITLFEGSSSDKVSGLISLFILFIGLRQAWVLTARRGIVITGPFQ